MDTRVQDRNEITPLADHPHLSVPFLILPLHYHPNFFELNHSNLCYLGGVSLLSEHQKTSKRLRQALPSLQLSLPPLVAAKVGANYAGMAPMERYKAETLGGAASACDAHISNVGEGEACFSCQATAGAVSDKGEAEGILPSSCDVLTEDIGDGCYP